MKTAGRIAVAIVLICVVIGSGQSVQPGRAQSPAIEYTQSVTAIYGTKLTFTLEVTASTELSAPELVVVVDHRPGEFRRSAPDIAPTLSMRLTQPINVDELGLPPYSVIRYWWEVNDGAGQRISTEPVLMLYEDTSVPWVWQVNQQANVVVHAPATNAGEAVQALAAAIEAQRELSLLIGARTDEILHIYVYPELAQMAGALRLHHIQVNDWVAAYALPEQRVSFVALEDGPSRASALQEDVSHEVSHLVMDISAGDAAGRIPAWFSEGAALTLAAQPDASLTSILEDVDTASGSQFRTGELLCESSFGSLSPREAALAYAHSGALFSYILDRYGASQLQGFLTAYTDGVSCLDAFNLVLGTSFPNVYDQWKSAASRIQPSSRSSNNNLAVWILGWGVSLLVAMLFLAPFPISKVGPAEDAYSTKLRLSQIDD